MATCSECTHFQASDEVSGTCFGHEVPADADSSECPANAFQAKEAE